LPCTLALACTETLILTLAWAATWREAAAQVAPDTPRSPSALNVPAVFPAKATIGSLSASVSAKASFTSPRWALMAAYSLASPTTASVAVAVQLTSAWAEPWHDAWQSALPLQSSVPVQVGGLAAAEHEPWHSPLQSALPGA